METATSHRKALVQHKNLFPPMESYQSDLQTIYCDINTVFSKLSHPENFKTQIDKNIDQIPQDAKENLKKVTFDADSITIQSPMGPLKLQVTEIQEPSKIKFAAVQSPVAFGLTINLGQVDAETTTVQSTLELDLPIFVRGMVGGQLKKAAKQFGEMLAKLPYRDL